MSLPPSLKESSKPRRWVIRSLRVLLAGAFGILLSQVNLEYVESYLYDLRVQLRPVPKPQGPIHLVLVRPETLAKYKGAPSAASYSELLRRLSQAGAKYILFTPRLEEVDGSMADKVAFVNLARSTKGFFAISDELEMKGEEGKIKLPPPLQDFPILSGPRTQDRKILAKDGVTRRFLISAYDERPMLQTLVAQDYNPQIKDLKKIRGPFELIGTQQAYIQFSPSGSYRSWGFEEVLDKDLQEEPLKSAFKDQIVILGFDYKRNYSDYILTPYDRESVVAMTVAEMHANILNTLIENSAPIRLPPWFNILLTVLICILTVHLVLTARPAKGLLILGAMAVAFVLICWLAFWPFKVWLPMAHPLIAIFLCYYFFIPYRLIIENRRSWEYYQKNKLLKQVEELKTNFISMMSHDLKTPLARIQGMTDVILLDQTSISSQQREAVDTIRQSSDDLLRFISTILNYAKIESEGVELHKVSKDINSLLQEVIKKNEFHARLKKIQILTELEPLFPVSLDPDLVKQVFSNLVENAIKYSPEETKILVSSEESRGKIIVQVADQGQGIPSDEIPNVFMKFFRSKNARSSPIKGSGLGLYLAKYFTELHGGQIFVESTYGQGSTFTVELPLESRASDVR